MKIIFVIKAIGNPGGGAERVLCLVASGLARRGHEVSVMSNDPVGVTPYYQYDGSVGVEGLGIGNVETKSLGIDVLRRMFRVRSRVLRAQPDVVVAFMHSSYIPVGMALLGTGIPLVASEHIGPEHYDKRLVEFGFLQLTPLLSKSITVVSSQIRESFPWWLRRKMAVVVNPICREVSPVSPLAEKEKSGQVVLAVGRLAPQKDHATLIHAFGRIANAFPDWKLRIVGEGELRAKLRAEVEQLGLEERVELPGAIANIASEYAAADLFVMPSTYESFGLATAEALLQGLPCIGFADCPGTNAVIRDGDNGILVAGDDRVAGLASALETLMGSAGERARLAASSRQYLIDQFDLERVLDRWEEVLTEGRAH